MAKKRKKESAEEEEYEFKCPEFDERDYMKKEMRDAKVAIITIVFAIVVALMAYGLTAVGQTGLGLLFGALSLVLLPTIYRGLDIDTLSFEKKNWLGNGIMFLFTWIGIWILLCNPPFSDFADPDIEDVQFMVDGDEWAYIDDAATGIQVNESVVTGVNITIRARVSDNIDIKSGSVEIAITEQNFGDVIDPQWVDMTSVGDHLFEHRLIEGASGQYEFMIRAEDVNGHSAEYSYSFEIS